MYRYPVKKKKPFGKVIVLTIGLVVVFYLINKISTSNIIEQILYGFNQLGDKYSNLIEFTEEEKDSVKKVVAGFWTYTSDTGSNPFIKDRVEIKDNGYIWQVEKIQCKLPSGRKKSLTHAVFAYLYPSSKGVEDSTRINCIERILNQVWIEDEDTCEIREYIDDGGEIRDYLNVIKDVYTDKDKFEMDNREYTLYKHTDISGFFPPGIIEFVYNLSAVKDVPNKSEYTLKNGKLFINKEANQDKDKEIKLSVSKECKECLTLKDYLRKAISEDLQNIPVSKCTLSDIILIVKEYYIPFCLKDIIESVTIDKNIKSPTLKIFFELTLKGETKNIFTRIPGSAINKKWYEIKIIQEIEQWKFQRLDKESTPLKVSLSYKLE